MSKDSDKEFDAIRRALGANPKAAETDYLKSEIERLRRCLGVLKPIEERRAKTRERVRKHRQRQPKRGSLVGSWAKLMYDLGSRSREPASTGFVHFRAKDDALQTLKSSSAASLIDVLTDT